VCISNIEYLSRRSFSEAGSNKEFRKIKSGIALLIGEGY